MTSFLVFKLCAKYNLDIHETYIKISANASTVTGTSADLVQDDVLSIWQLLHGLMLPSGNDAAIALAEYFGEKLLSERQDMLEALQPKERGEEEKRIRRFFISI